MKVVPTAVPPARRASCDGAGRNYVEHPFFVSRAEARARLAAVHADKLDGELCLDLASVTVRERQLSGRSLSHLRRQEARGPHVVGHYLASRGLEHQVLAQVRHDLVPEQH